MTSPPWRMVTVDIDGSLTTVHGWLVLARQFGREQGYQDLMRRFRSGQVDELGAITGLLELAEGRTLAEVHAALARTPKLANIPEGVARLHAEGLRVALLTHNPPYVTAWYRRFAGFDDADGLFGRQSVGILIGPPEGIRPDKLAGLAALCRRQGVWPTEVVHVGDGGADAAVFPHVGEGIALNARRPEVDRAADRVLHTHDFQDVVDAVLGAGVGR
ncbi:MAG TPA: HAD family hydrolase [Thermoplasmata archaeon]|nr:HAD family hydrolase [Thermoplasmata archaeon]